MLKVDDINVYYGSIHAMCCVSFEVEQGEIVTLIGANRRQIHHFKNSFRPLHPQTGSIHFAGQNIVNVPPHKIVSQGLAQCPEGRRIFLQMTVEENLRWELYSAAA